MPRLAGSVAAADWVMTAATQTSTTILKNESSSLPMLVKSLSLMRERLALSLNAN